MSPLEIILCDLRELQSRLKLTGDSLWQIKSALQRTRREGHAANDFLPRRLALLQNEAQLQFEDLLAELRQMASKSLKPNLFVFHSQKEVGIFLEIKQTLRYLQNAYMDHSLRETLNHWSNLLP